MTKDSRRERFEICWRSPCLKVFKEEGNVRGNFDEFRDVSERKVECKVITRVSGNGYVFSFFLFF